MGLAAASAGAPAAEAGPSGAAGGVESVEESLRHAVHGAELDALTAAIRACTLLEQSNGQRGVSAALLAEARKLRSSLKEEARKARRQCQREGEGASQPAQPIQPADSAERAETTPPERPSEVRLALGPARPEAQGSMSAGTEATIPADEVLTPALGGEEERRQPETSGDTGGATMSDLRSGEAPTCVVCMEGPMTHIMIPCGHHCLCEPCSASVMAGGAKCPMCMQECQMSVRVFSAS